MEIWARPEITSGRTTLSTLDTTATPHPSRNRAAIQRACMNSVTTAGTQTIAGPTSGISAVTAVRAPNTTGEGNPTSAKPTPTSTPCNTAMSSAPKTTARVTAPICSTRRSRRSGAMGIRRTARVTMTSPSRRKKKSTNTVTARPTSALNAPTTKAPLMPTVDCSSVRAPAISHCWICWGVTGATADAHRMARLTIGISSRSPGPEMPDSVTSFCRRPNSSPA